MGGNVSKQEKRRGIVLAVGSIVEKRAEDPIGLSGRHLQGCGRFRRLPPLRRRPARVARQGEGVACAQHLLWMDDET